TTTSKQVSLLANNTTYYWRVNAKNSAGTSPYSAVASFTTIDTTQPPPAPVPASPLSGATGVPTSTTVSWNTSGQSDSYHLQVSIDQAFGTTVVDDSTIT